MIITTELENLLIIKDLIKDETVDYINALIKNYRNNYRTDETKNPYYKECCEVIEVVKKQLKEKGIEDYETIISKRVEKMVNEMFFKNR